MEFFYSYHENGLNVLDFLFFANKMESREVASVERNICKFISPGMDAKILDVRNFVYETDPARMKSAVVCNEHRAILITKGSGKIFCGTKNWPVEAGNLFFAFSGEAYCVQELTDLEYIYVSFLGDRADDLFRRFGVRAENRIFSGFDRLIPVWKESLLRASEENTDLCAESMLIYAFSRLSAAKQKMNVLLQSMISVTERCFTEPGFSISSVAEELGYNVKYISHVFKEKMGVSYTEYLRTMRIQYAVTLFDHGIDSVKNVAFLCGFRDPLYFSSVFKKTMGCSPSEYREKRE